MKLRKINLLILLAVVIAGCAVAIAEDNDSNIGNKEVLSTLAQRMQKKISVDFRNTPIEDVLRIMADQSGVDIIKSPKVTGEVTATLTEIPLEEALNNILAAHGYGYIPSNNMIRIVPLEEISEVSERLVSKIYQINYADVLEVETALKKFISPRGSLSANPGTSNIIVIDSESRMKAIADFIKEVDRITPQIEVEARIYDITSTENFDIGVTWQAGTNTPITDITSTETVDKTGSDTTKHEVTNVGATNPVTTTTTTHTVTDDGTGPVTEDKTVETTTGGTAAGTIADTTTNTTTAGASSSDKVTKTKDRTWLRETYSKSNPFAGGTFDRENGGTLHFGLLNNAIDLDMVLSMLHKQIGAKLLANPRILVLDNEKANIKIVTEIPYQQITDTSAGGSIGSTAFREVGVELEVVPHLTREGMIRIHLKPKFSVRTGDVTVGTASNQFLQPIVDRREADTILLIEDGQTVVLGGLRKKETTQDIRKVPMLGDMPVVGELFRSESEDTTISELVVFITPRIIEKPVLTELNGRQLKITDFDGPVPISTKAEKPKAEKLKAEKIKTKKK